MASAPPAPLAPTASPPATVPPTPALLLCSAPPAPLLEPATPATGFEPALVCGALPVVAEPVAAGSTGDSGDEQAPAAHVNATVQRPYLNVETFIAFLKLSGHPTALCPRARKTSQARPACSTT